MVSSVSSAPYSYLSQLLSNGSVSAQSLASTVSAPSTTSSTPTVSGNAAANASSLASSLLSGGSFQPAVLSLLQQDSSGSFDPVTSLLGGTSTNNGLTTLYSDLYNSVASATVQIAKNTYTPGAAGSAPTSAAGLITNQLQASVAYNQTLQQNAQAVLDANSYNANGVKNVVG